MDNDQLITFIAVAQSGSFSQAALKLHVTQPAVSKRIALLEQSLNARLFDRIGKTNKLTQAGQLTLIRANNILNERKVLRREIDDLSGSISGRLAISTSHHIGLHRLPGLLKKFVRIYPDVDLDMRFTDSEIAYQDVIDGDAALAIATLPNDQHHIESIKMIPLWQDKLVLVCPTIHPLCQLKTISFDDLHAYKAILPGIETFTRRIINDYFSQNNLSLNIAFETNYLETIRVMVASGLGWSVLPEILVNKDIQILDMPSLNLNRQLGVMVNTAISLPNSAKAMIALLQT